MLLRRVMIFACTLIALVEPAWAPVQAQYITGEDGIIERYNPFRFDPSSPVTVTELSKRIDCLTEQLRDDGLIVIKQPDVFSQARLTRFRIDLDTQFQNDLGRFELVLAARINRLDAATTTQTTTLGAALSPAGSSHVTVPTPLTPPTVLTAGPGATLDPTKSAFGSVGLDTKNFAVTGLGVEPTVYLDEKKRFLEHLNQIRRINLGPDQNDSSGYGLYLVRMPVSITPGECTYQGHGADLSVKVEHEFPPDFLPSSFQNLVINDLVDTLGPLIYEVIRTELIDDLEEFHEAKKQKDATDVRRELMIESLLDSLASKMTAATPKSTGLTPRQNKDVFDAFARFTDPLEKFILRDLPAYQTDPQAAAASSNAIAKRVSILIQARRRYASGLATLDAPQHTDGLGALEIKASEILKGRFIDDSMRNEVSSNLRIVALSFLAGPGKKVEDGSISFDPSKLNRDLYRPFLAGLYMTALPDDVKILDDLLSVPPMLRNQITSPLAASPKIPGDKLDLNLNTTRNPKQIYPIAPRELIRFFLEDNVFLIANDVKKSFVTELPRSTDVRSYLRQTLQSAYYAMSHSNPRPWANATPPLGDIHFIDELLEAIRERQFGEPGDISHLTTLFDRLIAQLESSRDNIKDKPIAALCWAIAIDSALLDAALRHHVREVFATKGMPSDMLDDVRFYLPKDVPNDMARAMFNDFVKTQWPIITFALDPVTDQQNIADSFNLKRDLQLALSYAFATGQVNFNQLNTFRRQLEQASDTIALNRTVSAVAHGNDSFGWRFSPRFQNPPNQRTNIGVIASQLIGGGPGPDYGTKKSKLEPGIRELTAVVLLPTFLPTMRVNVAGNWFKLTDPEHLIFHTKRMMEQGRRVQELRQAVLDACSTQRYRDADLRNLQAKLAQLEAMLPMQSTVVQLPFENTASGFDLFSQGATALVPELSGFEGVDVVKQGYPADIFLFGKYFNILDTKVIAGGKVLIFKPGDPTNQVDILSREVIRVQIPADATPTTTNDEPSQQYIELRVATPNGISNRVFVPYQPTAAPAPQVAFDLNRKDSTELDIFYQWTTGPDGKTTLIATDDPSGGGKKNINISWDSPTSIAPKTLQATFSTTVTGQMINFSLPANIGNTDDYTVDSRLITVILLNRLQKIVTYPTLLPASLSVTIKVQPYVPVDSMGYRVLKTAKALKTPLTVKLVPNVTNKNALPGVIEPPPPPAPLAPPAKPGASTSTNNWPSGESPLQIGSRDSDPSLIRTAQAPLGLPIMQAPNIPFSPPANLGSIANQFGGLPPLTPPPAIAALQQALPNLQTAATTAATGLAGQVATTPAQSIVVNTPPVVVVAPSTVLPAKTKSHSRLSKLFNHNRNGSGR